MIRLLLWCLVAWFIWKLVRGLTSGSTEKQGIKSKPSQSPPRPPFDNIEDAEFEDLTTKKDEKT